MNAKQKEVLSQQRQFLCRNIVWSEDLTRNLLAQGVVTDALLADIQDESGPRRPRKGRTARLLEVLPLRGSAMFDKFCDVLQMSGQPFIADFLRDEESGADVCDFKDIYKRVPALEKSLKDNDKKALDHLIITKVKEAVLKAVWSKDAIAREKDKAIEAKQRQLEDAFEYERKEGERQAEIRKLEKHLNEANNDNIELKSQVNFMKSQMAESENKLKSDINVHMNFGLANENQIRKLNEKLAASTLLLKNIEDCIKTLIGIPIRDSERQEMALMEFQFAFLWNDFERLIEKYKVLLEIEKQYENLTFERNYILAQLGFHSENGTKPSLIAAYQDFAVKTDESMTDLQKQLQKHSGVIEGQQEKIDALHKDLESRANETKLKTAGHVWQNAILGVMRSQLNDVKHESRMKDTKVKILEGEISKLKTRLAEMESNVQREVLKSPMPLSVRKQDVLSPSASARTHEDGDNKSAMSHRNTLLPPLGGKIQYAAPSTTIELAPYPTKRHVKAPQPAGYTRRFGDSRPGGHGSADGLVTQQLKLENRNFVSPGGVPDNNKLGHMSHGLGNLKAIHGKNIRNNVR